MIESPRLGHHLKVCIASMAPFLGGAEVAAERLALGLLEAGHEVFQLLGQRGTVMERMEKNGLRCIYSPMCFTDKWHWLRYLSARTRLYQVLKRERPDVVHSNDLPTHQILSDAARRLQIPRICHHRFPFDGPVIDWLNKYGGERHLFVSRALMHEMCPNSVRLQRSARAIVYDGLPLPPIPTQEDRLRARASLGLHPDRLLVAFAGQIIERKGVADLLQAWSLIDAETKSTAELLIVGDDLEGKGAYRIEMEKLARRVAGAIRFAGFQKNVGDWLRASDLAVVPSHVEPLGNATLEAMSFGLPVIACKVGGIPEMVVHEETGLLVPPRSPSELAQALCCLLRNPVLRHQYGRQGRQRCEARFSLQAHVGAVLAEYAHVVQRPMAASA